MQFVRLHAMLCTRFILERQRDLPANFQAAYEQFIFKGIAMQSYTSGFILTFAMFGFWLAYAIFEWVRTPKVSPEELRNSGLRNKNVDAKRDVYHQQIANVR